MLNPENGTITNSGRGFSYDREEHETGIICIAKQFF